MFNNKTKYVKNTHSINTRLRIQDGPVFEVIKPNNDTYRKSVIYSGALDWNSLESETRNIKELVYFKRTQKAWMINSYTI